MGSQTRSEQERLKHQLVCRKYGRGFENGPVGNESVKFHVAGTITSSTQGTLLICSGAFPPCRGLRHSGADRTGSTQGRLMRNEVSPICTFVNELSCLMLVVFVQLIFKEILVPLTPRPVDPSSH